MKNFTLTDIQIHTDFEQTGADAITALLTVNNNSIEILEWFGDQGIEETGNIYHHHESDIKTLFHCDTDNYNRNVFPQVFDALSDALDDALCDEIKEVY